MQKQLRLGERLRNAFTKKNFKLIVYIATVISLLQLPFEVAHALRLAAAKPGTAALVIFVKHMIAIYAFCILMTGIVVLEWALLVGDVGACWASFVGWIKATPENIRKSIQAIRGFLAAVRQFFKKVRQCIRVFWSFVKSVPARIAGISSQNWKRARRVAIFLTGWALLQYLLWTPTKWINSHLPRFMSTDRFIGLLELDLFVSMIVVLVSVGVLGTLALFLRDVLISRKRRRK